MAIKSSSAIFLLIHFWQGQFRGGDMDGGRGMAVATEFPRRLVKARNARCAAIMADLMPALYGLIAKHRISRDDLKATIAFLSDVDATCSENRQEWILLADALGISTAIESAASGRPKGATPRTILGPFFRADAPIKKNGDTISIDGVGTPMTLALQIRDLDGLPVAGAQVDVWQANAQGRFENQEPDSQPDMNLRGRFTSDAGGQVLIRTIRPGAYALPGTGPVAALLTQLGLGLRRPAHIQFRVRTPGFMTLTTHVFDGADPAIGTDPLFAARPELVADFDAATVRVVLTLARAHPGTEDT